MQVLAKTYTSLSLAFSGYIAGSGDGIVTVKGVPSSRHIYLLDAVTMQLLRRNQSLPNGHYIIKGLDPSKKYVVMVRDLPPNGVDWRGEPFAWDYVAPATDLTLEQQQALWASWQT